MRKQPIHDLDKLCSFAEKHRHSFVRCIICIPQSKRSPFGDRLLYLPLSFKQGPCVIYPCVFHISGEPLNIHTITVVLI